MAIIYSQRDQSWQLTEQDQGRREGRDSHGVPRLSHDSIHERNGDTSEYSAEASHSDIRHIGVGIVVSDLIESERTIKTNPPTRQSVQHLGQRRMNVEIVLSSDVVACKRSEMDFIEDDLIRMRDPPEPNDEGEPGEEQCCGIRRQMFLVH